LILISYHTWTECYCFNTNIRFTHWNENKWFWEDKMRYSGGFLSNVLLCKDCFHNLTKL